MKKEVMICDRCGKEIKNYISKFKHLSIENFSRPYVSWRINKKHK